VAISVTHADAHGGSRGTDSIHEIRTQAVAAAVVCGLEKVDRCHLPVGGDALLDPRFRVPKQDGAVDACSDVQDDARVVGSGTLGQAAERWPQHRRGDPSDLERVTLSQCRLLG
jgi:hypothetical protein